jgi:hypothetical protein
MRRIDPDKFGSLIHQLQDMICNGGACGPIFELNVQSSTEAGAVAQPDWVFCPVDVNKGVGNTYLYIGYSKTILNPKKGPIVDIKVGIYSHRQTSVPSSLPDYEMDPTDLNMGVHGKYIYLFWKRAKLGTPTGIVNFMILANGNSAPDQIAGYDVVVTPAPGSGSPPQGTAADLNAGAGGYYIWMYTSTTICPDPKQGWVVPDGQSL